MSSKPLAFVLALMLAAACVPLASGLAVRRARFLMLRASVLSRQAACFALRRWRAAPQTVRVPPRIRRAAALRRWRAAAPHLLCPSGLASLAGCGGSLLSASLAARLARGSRFADCARLRPSLLGGFSPPACLARHTLKILSSIALLRTGNKKHLVSKLVCV